MWRLVRRCALGLTAFAAASAPAATPSRTQILFLGTAGGPPLRFDRAEPSTLLIVNGREYLIDCGIGTARRLIEADVDSSRITTIFFTHLHADHAMGLADVMANDFSRAAALETRVLSTSMDRHRPSSSSTPLFSSSRSDSVLSPPRLQPLTGCRATAL